MMQKLLALTLKLFLKILKTQKMNHALSSTHAHTTQLVLTQLKNNGEKLEKLLKKRDTLLSLICHIKDLPLVMLLMMLSLLDTSLKDHTNSQLSVLTHSQRTSVFMDKELVLYIFTALLLKKLVML